MNQARKIFRVGKIIFYILILFLPTQLGKHFWFPFTQVLGIRIDYLSPTLYITDIFVILLFLFWIGRYMSFLLSPFKDFTLAQLTSPYPLLRGEGKSEILPKGEGKEGRWSSKIIWLIFFVYLSINTVLSNNPLLSLYGLVKVLEMGFFGYYVSQAAGRKKELSRVAFITVICIMIESLLAIAQYSHQASINGLFYFLGERRFTALTPGIANASVNGELFLRPYGTFSHPNILAGYLLCMMVFVHSFLDIRKSIVKKSIKLFAMTVGSIALLLTLSRVAIVLWMVMAIAVSMNEFKKRFFNESRIYSSRECSESRSNSSRQARTILFYLGRISISPTRLFTISAIFFIVACLFFLPKSPIVSRLLETKFAEEAFIQRIDFIKSATLIIESRPFFGVGLYNFIPSLSRVQKPVSGVFYFQPVHNIYLLIGAEIGIAGFLFFLVFIFKTYRHLIKLHKGRSKMLVVLLSSVLVLGLFDHYLLTLQQGQLLFAFVLGLCWSVNKTSP